MLENFLEWEKLGKLKYDAKFVAECLIVPPDKGVAEGGGFFAFPQTFMNLSGNAVESIARFYKIPAKDILVLHDEIDFITGKIALKI
jgi:peptidyl-tRNA hydrolase